MTPHLTLGPVLLNWRAESWRDFYFQVADEMPVDTVFLGEVICSKRAACSIRISRQLRRVSRRRESG